MTATSLIQSYHCFYKLTPSALMIGQTCRMSSTRVIKDRPLSAKLSVEISQRGPGCCSARGLSDQDLQIFLNTQDISSTCKSLDFSDNLLPQRAASLLAKFIQQGKVSKISPALMNMESHYLCIVDSPLSIKQSNRRPRSHLHC